MLRIYGSLREKAPPTRPPQAAMNIHRSSNASHLNRCRFTDSVPAAGRAGKINSL